MFVRSTEHDVPRLPPVALAEQLPPIEAHTVFGDRHDLDAPQRRKRVIVKASLRW